MRGKNRSAKRRDIYKNFSEVWTFAMTEFALQLRQLYRYVNEQLIATLVQRRPIHLDAACEVIRGLMESFEQVAKEDHSGPVMEHSQQLYAGLTYGKGTLNEVSLGEGSTYGGKI